jgi:hypothetical protein
MRINKDELEAVRFGEYEGRMSDLGEWRVAWEAMPAHFPPDPSPFRGLPDDRCQCLHLGVVVKGAFRVEYPDGSEEIVRAGETYSLAPGHFVQTLEPTELIEFSPRDEHDRTMRQIEANMSGLAHARE